jgi:hypothetical protein
VFVLIITLSIVFSHGKDGSISAATKALQFKDPSPEQALDNTEDLAPSVQHEEVDMSISTLCTSIFCKSISSYALFVFYISGLSRQFSLDPSFVVVEARGPTLARCGAVAGFVDGSLQGSPSGSSSGLSLLDWVLLVRVRRLETRRWMPTWTSSRVRSAAY